MYLCFFSLPEHISNASLHDFVASQCDGCWLSIPSGSAHRKTYQPLDSARSLSDIKYGLKHSINMHFLELYVVLHLLCNSDLVFTKNSVTHLRLNELFTVYNTFVSCAENRDVKNRYFPKWPLDSRRLVVVEFHLCVNNNIRLMHFAGLLRSKTLHCGQICTDTRCTAVSV